MKADRKKRETGCAHVFSDTDVSPLLSVMPFSLTGAQARSIGEIASDMSRSVPMSRILCGDVGSGKTAVAAACAYIAAKSGYQCALMAPTEILAKQHAASLSKLFAPHNIPVFLLTGSTTKKELSPAAEAFSAALLPRLKPVE